MPKTVQIRDLDEEVYATLVPRAVEAGMSVPESREPRPSAWRHGPVWTNG